MSWCLKMVFAVGCDFGGKGPCRHYTKLCCSRVWENIWKMEPRDSFSVFFTLDLRHACVHTHTQTQTCTHSQNLFLSLSLTHDFASANRHSNPDSEKFTDVSFSLKSLSSSFLQPLPPPNHPATPLFLFFVLHFAVIFNLRWFHCVPLSSV